MHAILDVKLSHEYWQDLGVARQAAQIEAANTGGTVLAVESVEVQGKTVSFIGVIPEGAIENAGCNEAPPNVGGFHTTWASVLSPTSCVGFLVLHHPITARCLSVSPEGERVAIILQRSLYSLPATVLGSLCCRSCGEPISTGRLRARPGTRLCTLCQSNIEERINGN